MATSSARRPSREGWRIPPAPLFKEVRELILRKCRPGKAQVMRTMFEKEPFGALERLVTQKLLDVVKRVTKEEVDDRSGSVRGCD